MQNNVVVRCSCLFSPGAFVFNTRLFKEQIFGKIMSTVLSPLHTYFYDCPGSINVFITNKQATYTFCHSSRLASAVPFVTKELPAYCFNLRQRDAGKTFGKFFLSLPKNYITVCTNISMQSVEPRGQSTILAQHLFKTMLQIALQNKVAKKNRAHRQVYG